jgi:hypothetical protein
MPVRGKQGQEKNGRKSRRENLLSSSFAVFAGIDYEIMKINRLSFCDWEPPQGLGHPSFHVIVGLSMASVTKYSFWSDSGPGFLSGKRDPFF